MKCIHHNDLDGKLAGRIVAEFEKNSNRDDFIEKDYESEFPFDKISSGEKVYIVDYSFSLNKVDDLKKLLSITENVIWIDHHASSEKTLSEYPEFKKIKGIVKEGICGAALTYMFLNKVDYDKIPTFIKFVSDYDCWHFKYGNDTRYFKCYMDSVDYGVFAKVWDKFIKDKDENFLDMVLDKGELIYGYVKQSYKEYKTKASYEDRVARYKALVINVRGNSWYFGDDIDNYDICVTWYFNGSNFVYSLYSKNDKIDVSAIAEKYGGGGHPQAAGFVSKKRIW